MAATLLPPDRSSRSAPAQRLWFLDNLKVILTAMVILHHVGQAYGPTGGFWYFYNPERWPILGLFFWVNASYFMGLFFFISGYFMPGSFDRNGTALFLKDRLVRFGAPILLFLLLVHPMMLYLSYSQDRGGSLPFLSYVPQIYFGLGPKPAGWVGQWPDLHFGHLWFVEHLLVYAFLYAGWRLLWRGRAGEPSQIAVQSQNTAPSDLALLGYALGLAAVTYLVRIWYPINSWVGFLGFIQMEPAHLPQYASLLILGMVAYRRGWAEAMPAARGWRWLGIAAAAILLTVAGRAGLLGEALRLTPKTSSTIYTIHEAFIAVGMAVGLITLFREFLNRTGPFLRTLSADAYGAYLIHFPIVLACQYAAALVPAGPAVRFLLAGAASVALSFAAIPLLRKIPGSGRVL